ncbi:hypothetical protein HanPSC8_Chr04g0174951 [Helianthus annuus]|nr:hypothetical protein HanPSC8_Chr04g0174951 [Helianthus annuus]
MHLVAEVGRHATLFAIASATVAIDNYEDVKLYVCKFQKSFGPDACYVLTEA